MKKILAQTIKLAAAAVFLTSGLSFTAHAGLVGVKSIQISSAYTGTDAYLQVAEVLAYSKMDNVALTSSGAKASAPSSNEVSSEPIYAIDGINDGDYYNNKIFHSGSTGADQILTITLASPQELVYFGIWGRTDCCSYRDIYNVSFLDDGGTRLGQFKLNGSTDKHFAELELPATRVVPEPGSLALFGLGLAGLAAVGRKRKA